MYVEDFEYEPPHFADQLAHHQSSSEKGENAYKYKQSDEEIKLE